MQERNAIFRSSRSARSSSSRLVAPTHDTRQLIWLLAWAVVFCDIGTSVYYAPGILLGHVRNATPFFVLLTTGGFILLSLKYIEISWRNPEGGGVVTITTKAFGPRSEERRVGK